MFFDINLFCCLILFAQLITWLHLCRQRDGLNKTMSASGYLKNVPKHVHDDNQAKLEMLMQQLSLCEDATQRLEKSADASENGANGTK